MFAWLPELYLIADYAHDQEAYVEALYERFHSDFLRNPFEFRGKRVAMKAHPKRDNKEATFWHIITEGQDEANRTVKAERCERIGWAKALMVNVDDPNLKVWDEVVKNEVRTHIWCEQHRYIVVVADRGKYVLPWTAFHIDHAHQNRKFEKRWQTYR